MSMPVGAALLRKNKAYYYLLFSGFFIALYRADNAERRGNWQVPDNAERRGKMTTRKDAEMEELIMFDERYIDLQFFAEDPAEDDDLLGEDDNEDFGEEFDLEEAEEETEEEDEKEDETEEKTEQKPEEQRDEKLFTKADVERIVYERFLRDPSRVAAKQLEDMTGMSLSQIADYIREQQEKEEVNKLMEEKGWDEEDATAHVRASRQNKELIQRARMSEQQIEMMQNQFNYFQDKARFANDPLIKKYEAEIDAFSQNGKECSFETAANYILGQKIRSGELLNDIKSGAVNRTLANLEKQSKVKVEQGSYSGRSAADEGLDPFTRSMAARFGISPKEVKVEQAKIARERRGKRR